MEIDILEKQNLVTVWLTNADQQNPAVLAQLKEIYAKYKDTNYKVGVFRSGKGDLYENTRDLLLYNRRRTAQREVEAARTTAKAAADAESRLAVKTTDSSNVTAVDAAKKPSVLAKLKEYRKDDRARSNRQTNATQTSL